MLSFLRELSATEIAPPQDKGIVPVIFQEPKPSVVMDNKLLAGKMSSLPVQGKT